MPGSCRRTTQSNDNKKVNEIPPQSAGRIARVAGLADGRGGSVVFVITGDGKELWRSKKITDASLPRFEINVRDVKELTFQVEDGGNGNSSDWGVWCDLKVVR